MVRQFRVLRGFHLFQSLSVCFETFSRIHSVLLETHVGSLLAQQDLFNLGIGGPEVIKAE